MNIPQGHILVKASKGKATHNGDGRYKKTWRLWSDGTVQRTSSRSKYQQPFTDELIPQAIRETKTPVSEDPSTFVTLKGSLVDKFGHRPVEDITRDDMKAELKAISKGTAIAGNRALAAIRKFFNWCIAEGYVTVNPVDKMQKPQDEVSRTRWLKSDDEFRAVWLASGELGWPFGPIYQLLILLGQRREEVAGMRWRELDIPMKTWTIPPERSKNGEEHTVPLSAPALAIIENLIHVGRSEFVFTRTGKTPVSGWSSAKRRLDKHTLVHLRRIVSERGEDPANVEMEEWRTHDLRRTMASRMGDIDVMPHVVEVVLNHVGGFRSGVAGVYNRNSYQRPMRAALDAWGVEVLRLAGEASASSNVVLIGGRVA